MSERKDNILPFQSNLVNDISLGKRTTSLANSEYIAIVIVFNDFDKLEKMQVSH